ncbi:MAG TPA: thioredoxin [Cytophagaceae bacterium]
MGKFEEIINAEEPVLVDFYADWCSPCKAMAPELVKLAGKVKGKAKVIKVDVDKNPEAAVRFQIRGIPTLILFKKGHIRWRQSGMMNAEQLENAIVQNLL